MPDDTRTEVVNFRLDTQTYQQLQSEADDHGLTLSAYLRQIINDRTEHASLEDRIDQLETDVELLKEHVATDD